MRRPHRSIETFDISLMAVVTKAMGAFLVLMLLLLPYYTPNKLTEQDTQDLLKQLLEVRDSIENVAKQLGEDKTGPGAQESLKTASNELELSAEIVRKLRALLDKALADVAWLEKENRQFAAENDQLAGENRQLEADLNKAKQEIEELRKRIRDLEDKLQNLDRSVFVHYAVEQCRDIRISGAIFRAKKELTFTWKDDGEKMKREQLLYVNLGSLGGVVSDNIPKETIRFKPTPALGGGRSYLYNAQMLANTDVNIADYLVVLAKRHKSKSWRFRDKNWDILTPSQRDCTVQLSASAKIGDKWNSTRTQRVKMRAEALTAIVMAFTSDKNGIKFRAPDAEEYEWFAALLDETLNAQEAGLKKTPKKSEKKEPAKSDGKKKQDGKKKEDGKKR